MPTSAFSSLYNHAITIECRVYNHTEIKRRRHKYQYIRIPTQNLITTVSRMLAFLSCRRHGIRRSIRNETCRNRPQSSWTVHVSRDMQLWIRTKQKPTEYSAISKDILSRSSWPQLRWSNLRQSGRRVVFHREISRALSTQSEFEFDLSGTV